MGKAVGVGWEDEVWTLRGPRRISNRVWHSRPRLWNQGVSLASANRSLSRHEGTPAGRADQEPPF
jgi:hypothetical protein